MAILKSGGSAVDAVEMAIRVLEDRELTNSGFGSNLAMDGTVECDATIVDHLGQSGAVGAAGREYRHLCSSPDGLRSNMNVGVLNPIHLARLILDNSLKPLSLHRVPPNLLVAEGATDFAFEHGMPILPHDALISHAARDRWRKWRHELHKVEDDLEVQPLDEDAIRVPTIEKTGTWNEGQPASPMVTAERGRDVEDSASDLLMLNTTTAHTQDPGVYSKSYRYHANSPAHQDGYHEGSPVHRYPTEEESPVSEDSAHEEFPVSEDLAHEESPVYQDPALEESPKYQDSYQEKFPGHQEGNQEESLIQQDGSHYHDGSPVHQDVTGDHITDTVGAIAIDCNGYIAAGSSSGGIGMKHKGRVGPAALVGIGTYVIPVASNDNLKVSVATVASGTGEHMTNTMAASRSAERLYYNRRKGKNGELVDTDEEYAIRSFIENDFLG